MKTYKTWEAIKMLSGNPKLQFKCEGVTIYTGSSNFLEGDFNKKYGTTGNVHLYNEWTLVQEPVTFIEAVNSGKRFKAIEWNKYYTLMGVLDTITGYGDDRKRELLNGKWIIENES